MNPGTPEAIAHWNAIRAAIKPFSFPKPVILPKLLDPNLLQAVIACQTMASTAFAVANMKFKTKPDTTVWWQDRQAHWSRVARQLMNWEDPT